MKRNNYINGWDRKSCDGCFFYKYDTHKPKQEREHICNFEFTPNVVDPDGLCDEYQQE